MSNQHLAATRAQDSAGVAVVPADNSEVHFGLTKREYFAAMALQGFVGSAMFATAPKGETAASIVAKSAALSVTMADALIAALNKEPKA